MKGALPWLFGESRAARGNLPSHPSIIAIAGLRGWMMNDLIRRWWSGRDLSVGLQLSETEIVATYASSLRGKEHLVSVSGPMPRGAFCAGAIQKPGVVGIAIRDTLSKTNCTFDRCGVALDPSHYFMRIVEFPRAFRSLDQSGQTAWALEHLKFDISDVSGVVLWPSGQSHGVVVAVRRHVLDSYRAAMRRACLDLDLVTLRPVILNRLAIKRLQLAPRRTAVLIDGGSGNGAVYIADQGDAYDAIGSFWTLAELTEVLRKTFDLIRKRSNASISEEHNHLQVLVCCDGDSHLLASICGLVNSCAAHGDLPTTIKAITPSGSARTLVSEALADSLRTSDVN